MNIPHLLTLAAERYSVTPTAITGPSRRMAHVEARHACAWILRRKCHLTLQAIGETLGNRDHGAIIHAVSRVEQDECLRAKATALWEDACHLENPPDSPMTAHLRQLIDASRAAQAALTAFQTILSQTLATQNQN